MRMFRLIWVPGLTLLCGLLVGFVAAGPGGGVIGSVLGMMMGLLLLTGRDAVRPTWRGKTHLQSDRVLCIPKGQVAECSFVREDATGRWVDVASCSLCHPPEEIGCRKRCLILMNDMVGPRSTTATA
jgi:hypothetical protein